MVEIDGVAYADSLGCDIYNLVALVVVEVRAYVEPGRGAEVP